MEESPAEPEPPAVDLGALVRELRERAEERRRSGAYPPGLEHDLDVHFRHIVEHRPVRDLDSLHKAMESFESRLTFDIGMIPAGSRMPGGDVLHKTVSKLIVRQTGWLAQQLQGFAESVRLILWKMIETLDRPTHVHAELTAELDAVLDRLAYYERAPADAAMLGSILRRLEALESAHRAASGAGPGEARPPSPPAGQALATGPGPLTAGAIAERLAGLEPSAVLYLPEALGELTGAEPASLGGIGLLGGLDALAAEDLSALLAGAAAALRPGGLLVVDSAGPLHPAELAFSCRQAGFADVTVEWRPPPPEPGVHCTITAVR
jgi:hypothetical protein